MKRLTALPASAYRADRARLARRQAELTSQRKNAAVVYRDHKLAVAACIRREFKEHGVAA